MYKKRDRQIYLDDFNQPYEFEINPNNRWVKKAELIPWDDVEREYSSRFSSKVGQVAKSARLALGALLIQKEYGVSDAETASMIQENPYFQYFCGMRRYTHEVPFDPSLMTYFRKRFTPEMIAAINEKIIESASNSKLAAMPPEDTPQEPDKNSDDESSVPPNIDAAPSAQPPEESPVVKGTLILDATCAPSNIKYPTDTDLLNKSREDTEKECR